MHCYCSDVTDVNVCSSSCVMTPMVAGRFSLQTQSYAEAMA